MSLARLDLDGWRGAALALAAACLARAPLAAFDRPYDDEAFYALIGRRWLAGYAPYADVWDIKGPGLFALYALSDRLTGDALIGIWLLPLACVCATCLGLLHIGRVWFCDARLGLVAAILYAALTLGQDGVWGGAVLLSTPFVVWGFIGARTAHALPVFGGGALLGLGVCVYQTAGFEALGALALVGLFGPSAGRAGRLLALCAGGALAPLAFVALFAAHGALADAWGGAVLAALLRAQYAPALSEAPLRALVNLKGGLPLAVVCLLALVDRTPFRACAASWRVVGLWLGAALLGLLALRGDYERVYLSLAPPACLVAAAFLHAMARQSALARRGAFALGAGLLIAPVLHTALADRFPTQNKFMRETARALEARGGAHDGRADLFVVDHEPSLYLLAGKTPPGRFVFPQHLLCAFGLPQGVEGARELDRLLDQRPRFLVLRSGDERRLCQIDARLAQAQTRAAQDYDEVARFGDARYGVVLYERRESLR